MLTSFSPVPMTDHARRRQDARRLPDEAIDATVAWGREIHTRGAHIFVVGRREVGRASEAGVDLSKWEGVQVVCHPSGVVLTCYRNRKLSRACGGWHRGRHN